MVKRREFDPCVHKSVYTDQQARSTMPRAAVRWPLPRQVDAVVNRSAGYHIAMNGPPVGPEKWLSASISLYAPLPRFSGSTFSSMAPIQ